MTYVLLDLFKVELKILEKMFGVLCFSALYSLSSFCKISMLTLCRLEIQFDIPKGFNFVFYEAFWGPDARFKRNVTS